MSFINYCKIRIPELIGVCCIMYIIITSIFPDRRSDWFNSLSDCQTIVLYSVLIVITIVCIIVEYYMSNKYMKN